MRLNEFTEQNVTEESDDPWGDGYGQGVAEGTGNWYIRYRGKVLKDKKFNAIPFPSQEAAHSKAMELHHKKRYPLELLKLTQSWMDAPEQGVAEADNNYHANRTGFAHPQRNDDERHDLDVPRPLIYGLKINGKIWQKDGNTVTFFTRERALAARNAILAKRPDVEVGLVQGPKD